MDCLVRRYLKVSRSLPAENWIAGFSFSRSRYNECSEAVQQRVIGKPFSLHFPMPYQYVDGRRAETSLDEVANCLKQIALRDRARAVRYVEVRDRSEQSAGAVAAHLDELIDRGQVLKVGVKYLPVEALDQMKLHELHSLAKEMSREQAAAHTIQQKAEEKAEQMRQQLMSLSHRDEQMERMAEHCERRAAYHQRKWEQIKTSRDQVLAFIKHRVEAGKVEKSQEQPPRSNISVSPKPLTA